MTIDLCGLAIHAPSGQAIRPRSGEAHVLFDLRNNFDGKARIVNSPSMSFPMMLALALRAAP
jgi:hypothetical protein